MVADGPPLGGEPRMNWKRAITCLALTPALAVANGTARGQGAGGRITGMVPDRAAGSPIANVSVTVTGTTIGTRSTPDGHFVLTGVPAGSQRIHAARIGYTPLDQTVNITAGQAMTLTVSLAAASVTLD